MDAREAIQSAMTSADMIWKAYVEDLSDEDLLVRPVEGANHIAWQLGHLISSENGMVAQVCPGSMPTLPDGFSEKYTKETSEVDDSEAFHSKDEYLKLFEEQRAGTLAALAKLSADDLSQPAPESLRQMWPSVGAVISMQPTHWVMHAGQWAIIRRKLGRQPLF